MKAHRQAIKEIYSPRTLQEIGRLALMLSPTSAGDRDFATFHKNLIQGVFPGLKIDYTTTNTIRCCAESSVLGAASVCLNVSPKLIEQYLSVAEFDILAATANVNYGRAIIYDPDSNLQRWVLHPDFEAHCQDFAIGRAIQIAFRYPSKHNTYLSMEYLGEASNKTWQTLQFSRLELASFPFALAWLYRKDIIDDAELLRRFRSLEGFTEIQLANLRKFINSPFEDYRQQALTLGIKTGSYKEALYLIRDKASSRFGWNLGEIGSTHMKMRPVESEYSFIKMLGDHTREIIKVV